MHQPLRPRVALVVGCSEPCGLDQELNTTQDFADDIYNLLKDQAGFSDTLIMRVPAADRAELLQAAYQFQSLVSSE